jgi:hypothetical protein
MLITIHNRIHKHIHNTFYQPPTQAENSSDTDKSQNDDDNNNDIPTNKKTMRRSHSRSSSNFNNNNYDNYIKKPNNIFNEEQTADLHKKLHNPNKSRNSHNYNNNTNIINEENKLDNSYINNTNIINKWGRFDDNYSNVAVESLSETDMREFKIIPINKIDIRQAVMISKWAIWYPPITEWPSPFETTNKSPLDNVNNTVNQNTKPTLHKRIVKKIPIITIITTTDLHSASTKWGSMSESLLKNYSFGNIPKKTQKKSDK